MGVESFVEAYKTVVFNKYAAFEGRAGRREFWSFVLVNFVIGLVISFTRLQALSMLYSLAVLVPSLAVGARRLHDTNRSGWLLLLGLIPVIGAIILLVFAAQEGTKGSNKYGADPAGGDGPVHAEPMPHSPEETQGPDAGAAQM